MSVEMASGTELGTDLSEICEQISALLEGVEFRPAVSDALLDPRPYQNILLELHKLRDGSPTKLSYEAVATILRSKLAADSWTITLLGDKLLLSF